MLEFARKLRQQTTDAEALLWYLLRNRRLPGLKFRRQYAVPPFVLDFYCIELKLAVELDGGHHNGAAEALRDHNRSAELGQRGIEVVRYWNNDVLDQTEEVLSDLVHRLMRKMQSLTPTPLPEGEGNNHSSLS